MEYLLIHSDGSFPDDEIRPLNAYSFRERGLNEYTNVLIRQYIPKGTDFDKYDDLYIKKIQHKMGLSKTLCK